MVEEVQVPQPLLTKPVFQSLDILVTPFNSFRLVDASHILEGPKLEVVFYI